MSRRDLLRCQIEERVMLTFVEECRIPVRTTGERVYFIECGEGGPVKIGFTRDLPRRLVDLQIANPYTLRVLLDMPAPEPFEAALHKYFASAHIRGEWFSCTPALLEWIDRARDALQEAA